MLAADLQFLELREELAPRNSAADQQSKIKTMGPLHGQQIYRTTHTLCMYIHIYIYVWNLRKSLQQYLPLGGPEVVVIGLLSTPNGVTTMVELLMARFAIRFWRSNNNNHNSHYHQHNTNQNHNDSNEAVPWHPFPLFWRPCSCHITIKPKKYILFSQGPLSSLESVAIIVDLPASGRPRWQRTSWLKDRARHLPPGRVMFWAFLAVLRPLETT